MIALIASIIAVVMAGVLFVLSVASIYSNTFAWWDRSSGQVTGFDDPDGTEHHWFTILLPCRKEPEAVMRATLDRLLSQSHRRLDVIISTGHDDPETIAIAERLAAEHPGRVSVSVDHSVPKNKPKQMNTALGMCRGDIIGIFDAESVAAPELIAHVDATFHQRGADVVQGAVQLINFQDSWFSLRNCLEYYIWFRSRLHQQTRGGFIPLGGNTVFLRRDLLEEIGGWDGNCLAEDCDLGVRLSTLGRRIEVGYAPHLVTREETPESVTKLVKQRTRWALGFMQVYAKGLWRRVPGFRTRAFAWWTLTQFPLLALSGVLIPIGIAFALVFKFPLWVTLAAFLPLVPTLLTVALDVHILRDFGRDMQVKVRPRDYLSLVVMTPIYQGVLAFSALRAFWKLITRDFAWEKTDHSGAHLHLVTGHTPAAPGTATAPGTPAAPETLSIR